MLSPMDPSFDLSGTTKNDVSLSTGMSIDFRQAFMETLKTPGTIKPISSSAMRLLEACRNPSGKMADLVELIEADPAIAMRTLALANSPVYGQTRMISSVKQSVVVLGMTSISQLATSFALTDTYLDSKCTNPVVKAHQESLFFHSIGTASVARNIAAITETVDEGAAYLAGALHDLGKQIFWELIPDEYEALHQREGVESVYELEQQILGITHEEVGAFCAQNWGLPQEIVSAIGFHHRPDEAGEEKAMVELTESANAYALHWGVGSEVYDAESDGDGTPIPQVNLSCAIQLEESQQVDCLKRSQKELGLILQACGIALPKQEE